MTEITFIEDFTHIYKTLLQDGITMGNIRFVRAELTCLFEQYFYENEEVEIKATEKALADMQISIKGICKELISQLNEPFGEYESEGETDEVQGINYPNNA